jgi:hypothetical protein
MNSLRSVVLFLACQALVASTAWASDRAYVLEIPGCGVLGDNFAGRPMDYRKATSTELARVEKYHWHDERNALLRGSTRVNSTSVQGSVAGGLDYTLRVWPNHHGALAGLDRFGQLKKGDQPDNLPYPIDCYFVRAVSFAGDDGIVRILYASYLDGRGRGDAAREQMGAAIKIADDEGNAILHYRIGLELLRMGDKDRALASAKKAYQGGVVWPELRDKLVQAGVWQEPTASAASAQ